MEIDFSKCVCGHSKTCHRISDGHCVVCDCTGCRYVTKDLPKVRLKCMECGADFERYASFQDKLAKEMGVCCDQCDKCMRKWAKEMTRRERP